MFGHIKICITNSSSNSRCFCSSLEFLNYHCFLFVDTALNTQLRLLDSKASNSLDHFEVEGGKGSLKNEYLFLL